MVILITGASGFIGTRLAAALALTGHEVIGAVREPGRGAPNPAGIRYVAANFARLSDASDWKPLIAGVEVVINSVGIFRETGGETFEAVHVDAPRALFAACGTAGTRVVQISALGADAAAASRYHITKKAADDFLLRACALSVIVQPSLVYGSSGASGRLFTLLASLPLIPVPRAGDQCLQPIYIDDLVLSIVQLVERDAFRRQRVPLVGPEPVGVRRFLSDLRRAMGLGEARFVSVSPGMMSFLARCAGLIRGSLLSTESLAMLARGNTADPAATRELLGRAPRPTAAFIPADEAAAVRQAAALHVLVPLLRVAIAFVWIASGIVSLGLFPVEESYALLARAGIAGAAAPLALYGAATLDLAFGIASLALKRRRMLWTLQLVTILVYSAIISVYLPEYWLHPFGPVTKNVPLLAALFMLYQLDGR